MDQVLLDLSFRPVKLAWCLKRGDWDSLRRALHCTHGLWGGRFNPILIVDDAVYSNAVMRKLLPDVLYPLTTDPETVSFVSNNPQCPHPSTIDRRLWYSNQPGKPVTECLYTDVRHVIEGLKKGSSPLRTRALDWSDTDPLAYVFACTFGKFPKHPITDIDYERLQVVGGLLGKTHLGDHEAVPPHIFTDDLFSVNDFASAGVYPQVKDPEYFPKESGIFLGNADDFDDIVNYWNLRATGIHVLFLDPEHRERLEQGVFGYFQKPVTQPNADQRTIWSRDKEIECLVPERLKRPDGTEILWSWRYVDRLWESPTTELFPKLRSAERAFLAAMQKTSRGSTATVVVPPREEHQNGKLMLNVSLYNSYLEKSENDETFQLPYMPELNAFFGSCIDNPYTGENNVRVQHYGFSVALLQHQKSIDLQPLSRQAFFEELLRRKGIASKKSDAGLVTARLIAQLGGLSDTWFFKIASVRELIKKHPPEKFFSYAEALSYLSGTSIGKPLESYPFSPGRKRLTTKSLLRTLVDKGVLRIGLEVKCPHCKLNFWLSLDNAKSVSECALCARVFNITNQLSNHNWSYRTSGLFAYSPDQAGGIPVAITLSQLEHTTTFFEHYLLTESIELEPREASIQKCEVDFLFFITQTERACQLVLAECKGGKRITNDDVKKLTAVANTLTSETLRVYLLFAKLRSFEPAEVTACLEAQDPNCPRVILLSDRELESHMKLYEKWAPDPVADELIHRLEDLAQVTERLYLEPARQRLQDLILEI